MSGASRHFIPFHNERKQYLALYFHYYNVHGMEEIMFQKEIRYCHKWVMEAWRPETAKVNYTLSKHFCNSALKTIETFKI